MGWIALRPSTIADFEATYKDGEFEKCTFIVSDFETLWVESLSRDSISARFQSDNPAIDISGIQDPSNQLISKINSVLKHQASGDLDLVLGSDPTVTMQLEWPLLPQKLKWTFRLSRAEDRVRAATFKQLMLGALFTCQVLSLRSTYLEEEISHKDYHIRSIREQFDPSQQYVPPTGYRASLQPFSPDNTPDFARNVHQQRLLKSPRKLQQSLDVIAQFAKEFDETTVSSSIDEDSAATATATQPSQSSSLPSQPELPDSPTPQTAHHQNMSDPHTPTSSPSKGANPSQHHPGQMTPEERESKRRHELEMGLAHDQKPKRKRTRF